VQVKITSLKYYTGQVLIHVFWWWYLYKLLILQDVQLFTDTEHVKHKLLQPKHWLFIKKCWGLEQDRHNNGLIHVEQTVPQVLHYHDTEFL